jgi:hypothetical protein
LSVGPAFMPYYLPVFRSSSRPENGLDPKPV